MAILRLLILLLLGSQSHAFQSSITISDRSASQETASVSFAASSSIPDHAAAEITRLHVVLFGVGDLRVDDHLGLHNALSDDSSEKVPILPIMVLSDDTLPNIPGAVAHTKDTARLLVAALHDLNDSLQATVGGQLQVVSGSSLVESLTSALQPYAEAKIVIHVCNLELVDNELGYGAFSALANLDDSRFELKLWSNGLRNEPWTQLVDLPDKYPEYESRFVRDAPPKPPVAIDNDADAAHSFLKVSDSNIPSEDELTMRLTSLLGLDPARVKAEASTGLYGTHWGGMDAATIGSASVLDILKAYTQDCQEQDAAWSQHPLLTLSKCQRNELSLEHASMAWQLRGDGKEDFARLDTNWLAGESMTRYLAAPFLFGTISLRRIWSMSMAGSMFFQSPLRTLVESREWHMLLAARNMRKDAAYQGQGQTTYKYWRYQGFLCRYAHTDLHADDDDAMKDENILLVHGFGASCTQWNKLMHAIADTISGKALQGLAPDLIGFGQAEKPAISYTGYMWDSQVLDFVKEVAIQKHDWITYVVGGNSIGGFTSLELAACDTAAVNARQATSCGGPGSNRCSGLVLMNSAGPLMTEEEIAKSLQEGRDKRNLSIAQATILDGLPPCRPPRRPFARAIGSTLLAYLRPRIQSICTNLYPTNPSAVDDELCENILRDSLDPGAVYVMMAGAKLPPPRTANELLQSDFGSAAETECSVKESTFAGPVLIAQGVLDPLNDATNRMNRFGSLRRGIVMDAIQAGHCPHDELPLEVSKAVTSWMMTTRSERTRFVVRERSIPFKV